MEQQFISQATEFASNHTLMVLAWVAVFGAVMYTLFSSALSKMKIIDRAHATYLINKENAIVVDLRSDKEFKSGHIAGSMHIVPEDIKLANIGTLSKHQDRPVILVDNTGMVANSVASDLAKQGFAQIYSLKEGITGWNTAKLPLVKR